MSSLEERTLPERVRLEIVNVMESADQLSRRVFNEKLHKLVKAPIPYPRIGIVTTCLECLEQGSAMSDKALDGLAELATDVLFGVYDNESLAIWTF